VQNILTGNTVPETQVLSNNKPGYFEKPRIAVASNNCIVILITLKF